MKIHQFSDRMWVVISDHCNFGSQSQFNDYFQNSSSRDEIKEFFQRLKSPTEMEQLNIDPSKLTKSQILRLCTYFIEKKCNFNGEGVFIRSHVTEFDDEYSLQMEEIIKAIKA